MIDILESMEDAAERRLDEMTEGLPPGKFRCSCGEIEDLDHAAPSGPGPYSSPMCRKCLEHMMEEADGP